MAESMGYLHKIQIFCPNPDSKLHFEMHQKQGWYKNTNVLKEFDDAGLQAGDVLLYLSLSAQDADLDRIIHLAKQRKTRVVLLTASSCETAAEAAAMASPKRAKMSLKPADPNRGANVAIHLLPPNSNPEDANMCALQAMRLLASQVAGALKTRGVTWAPMW
eukprot:m.53989 g.53989  ORF g.53989 m.53989 type:complete len:162 (+) comp48683_c0_seq2:213-698(+)